MKPENPSVTDEMLHIARAVAALGDRIAMDKERLARQSRAPASAQASATLAPPSPSETS
jgi:hypothetical protein